MRPRLLALFRRLHRRSGARQHRLRDGSLLRRRSTAVRRAGTNGGGPAVAMWGSGEQAVQSSIERSCSQVWTIIQCKGRVLMQTSSCRLKHGSISAAQYGSNGYGGLTTIAIFLCDTQSLLMRGLLCKDSSGTPARLNLRRGISTERQPEGCLWTVNIL